MGGNETQLRRFPIAVSESPLGTTDNTRRRFLNPALVSTDFHNSAHELGALKSSGAQAKRADDGRCSKHNDLVGVVVGRKLQRR